MTNLMSDDGTGQSNGTVLDTAKWTTEGSTAHGGAATYQSTALQFASGNAGGYAGGDRTTRSFNITSVADIEVTGTFTNDGNEPYPQIAVRATTSTVDYSNGYLMALDPVGSTWIVQKVVSFSGTTLGTKTFTISGSTTYGFRFRVIGTSLKARVWTGTEPGTWDIDITDSTFTSAGKAGITVGAGNAAVAHKCTFDNIVVTDGTTSVAFTETTTLADALAVTAAVPFTETGSILDGTLSVSNVLATDTETVTLTDGTLAVTAAVPLAETTTLADALAVTALLATQTETLHVIDGTLGVTAAVPFAETLHVADAFVVGITTTMVETVTLTDGTLDVTAASPMGDVGVLADDLSVESFLPHHDLKTEIEFIPGEWTDVSTYVVAESESTGTFGRPTRYDDVGASTWSTTLRNSGGELTPTNVNSTFFPNVAKGKSFRTSLTYSGQDYPLFHGRITGITLPAVADIQNCVVHLQAADVMADLARKTLLSPFVEESRRQAAIHAAGCDVFPFVPSQVATDTSSIAVASTTFENKGLVFSGGTKLGTMYAMASGNGAGAVKSSSQDTDGALVEGQLTFEIGDNGNGKQTHPVLVVKPQVGFQQFEMFFKVPKDVLPPRYATGTHTVTSGQNWNTIKSTYGMTTADCKFLNPDAYPAALTVGQVLIISNSVDNSEWVLAHFWAGATEVFRVVLGNFNDTVCLAVKKPDNSAAFILNSVNLADERWRKITLYKTGTNKVRFNVNDSPSGAEQTFGVDLTTVNTVFLGGRVTNGQTGQQVQCPPVSLSGVAFQQAVCGVWYWYCLGAPPANITARDRLLELAAYASPVPVTVDVTGDLTAKVCRTPTTGRSVLECLQELARTVLGYLWSDPATGTLLLVNPSSTATPIATVTLEADDDGGTPPQWRDTIDSHPTRVTATCPSGSATSINATAEASGAYKEATLSTCAPTIAVARAVADRAVSTGKSLNLTNLTVDLITAQNPLWGALLPGLRPGALLRVGNIPAVVFGYDTADVAVETWTYSFTVDTATVTMETTPVNESTGGTPILHSFTVTGSEGTQTANTVTVAKPSGVVTGDLLLGIMTCDATGSIAALAPPDVSWTAHGAGGTGDSGFGQVWTKTVTASEPTTYDFTVGGTAGSAVLMSDDFTGSNGAALNSAKWTGAETRTGATRQIQSNAARLNPGTITGYGGRVSMKANIADKADVDLLISVKIANLDTFPQIVLRGDSGVLGQNGYEFRPGAGSGGSRLARVVGYATSGSGTIFGYAPGSIAANTWYKVRFQAIGTTIRAKIWLATDTEPANWGISATDSTFTAAGPIGIGVGGGNATGSTCDFDDAVVSDPNAITSVPEAKVTLLRVSGADTADPILVSPSWTNTPSDTTSHTAADLTIPTGGGLLVDHWHVLTAGSGSGGGGGGSPAAFSFGMSGIDSAADVTNVNTWLTNHSLKAIGHWTDNSVSSQQGAFGIGSGGKFGAWTGILDVAVGGIFSQANGGESGGDTWAHAGSGTYDSRWTTALNNIKTAWGARSAGNLHLRFAHEWNGSFSSWAVNNANAANFVLAFRRFADLAHSIIPGVQVVWSPNDGTSSLTHVDDGYPGSAYVDVIGPDSYNAYPHVNTLAAWNSKINGTDGNGNPVGIESWRQYALGKGKPLALPEFGNPAVDTGGGAGGGDAQFYAEAILAWFHNNGGFGAGQVKYACYFNIGTVGGYAADYLILANGSNGTVHQPLTAAAFRNGA